MNRIRLAVLLTTAFALLPLTDAVASPVVHDLGPGAAKAARDYWTPKRMREARNLDVLRAASPEQLASPGIGALSAPGATPPAPATIDPASSRPPRPPAAVPGAARITAPPFMTGQVDPAAMTTYPYSANGRLVGSFRRIGGYSCSATVVNSGSRSVILTAGHCVHDINVGWARHVMFVPAYLDDARPYGTWSARRLVATKGWIRSENFHGDYAAVKLDTSPGVIGDVVGEEGLAWNLPREQLFQAIGYPFNRGDTQLMWNCVSGTAGPDPLDRSRGKADTGIGCDMGGGSSGGGWTIRDTSGGTFVNGVTSYGYKRLKNILFSPYLTGKVNGIVNQADRG